MLSRLMSVLSLLLLVMQCSPAQQARPSYFPLETGNSWTYHVIKYGAHGSEEHSDTTITVGAQVLAPNGKRYFETTLGALRVDSATGMVWKFLSHPPMPPTDSTRHCTDTTEIGFTYLAADSGDTHMMCDFGRVWGLQFSSVPAQAGALHISRRLMEWYTLDRTLVLADSIGMCRQTYAGLGPDYFVWELTRATVYGSTFTPVQLLTFTAERLRSSVLLRWKTSREVENMGFEIQRKTHEGNTDWEAIGFAPASTTLTAADYRFEDSNLPPAGTTTRLRYRLRQIDFSGKNEYSPVQTVDVAAPAAPTLRMDITPMPVRSAATMRVTGANAGAWKYAVYDLHGRRVALVAVDPSTDASIVGHLALDGLGAGTYLLIAEHDGARIAKPFLYVP